MTDKLQKIIIKSQKATDLNKSKNRTTASGIKNDFDNGIFPMFYHTYDTTKSFVAVPPEWLKELATKAGENKFASEIGEKMSEVELEKEKIYNSLKLQAKDRSGTNK